MSAPTASTALGAGSRRGDRRFDVITTTAAAALLALLAAIAGFLAAKAAPALRVSGWSFFTERAWFPDAPAGDFGVAALAFGTVASSALAIILAVPVAVGSALFVTEIASTRAGRWLGYVLDLLAAVPSVVFGLWGLVYLVPRLDAVQRGLDSVLGWIPLFHSRSGAYGRSLFAAAVVLAIMVVPIVAALARELFRQVPTAHREAALALGATRWEMVRTAVLPASRTGLVGATMLGLGRALGETIAVALVLSASFSVNIHLVEPGGNTIAANIATKFGEAGATGRSALIASGLVLFAITLAVNALARIVIARASRRVLGRP
ncbi:MAG TPA: phosphate ABC transporter permease subunit PstC [Acidimicrobiales bacterium]|nr:phosphate ABC transporter permease subunit PstC [Acidimicrobiales bacterium]